MLHFHFRWYSTRWHIIFNLLWFINTYLAFIGSIVSLLQKFDRQGPVVGAIFVGHRKAGVICESLKARRQHMPVPFPYPGDLKKGKWDLVLQ